MFDSLSDKIAGAFKQLRSKGRLTEEDINTTISQIRRALLDADVALPAVRAFTSSVRQKCQGLEQSKALNPSQQIVKIVHEELVDILGGQTRELSFVKGQPTVFMLAGLQGAGKTTLAGKLGKWLASQGHHPLLVAADLQRPNAVNQLKIVGENAGVEVWAPEMGNGHGDPIEVSVSGVEYARENKYDVVVIDTAGRLGVDEEMMNQAKDIRDAVQPQEVIFVIDSMIGQDAVNTATAFRDGVGITGVVLSKVDGDTRGGAALSVRHVTGVPILFQSSGEKLDDFERFHADRMASRILDMGDVLTLIEKAEKAWDEKQQEELAQKMSEGDFDLNDFIDQLNQMKKLGSMKKLMGMLPGMAQYRKALDEFDESSISRIEAIIYSMTPQERKNPKILNGSRRIRIAKGSGTSVPEVNALMERFNQAKKMMVQLSRGGGMPGMPGMPGMGNNRSRTSKRKDKKKKGLKKGVSANPAKRAQQKAQKNSSSSGSAFGHFGTPNTPEIDREALKNLF
ncbi:MAG: signal recognition particle protein [Actinomycetaceae bacterium]|nr:signal recognition particle protein [Actinomycetaceae bacterium]